MLIARRTAPSGVYLLHIPKTAGTSLRVLLENYFDANEICPAYTIYEALTIPESDLGKYRFYRGHMGYGLVTLLESSNIRPVTVVLLRQPVARAISHFRYISKDTKHPKHDIIKKQGLTLLDFLRDKRLRGELCNMQVKQIAQNITAEGLRLAYAGSGGMQAFTRAYQSHKPRMSPHAELDLAIRRLETLEVVGVVESYEQSVDLIAHRLGLRPSTTNQKLNVSGHLPDDSVDRNASELLEELNSADLQLYNAARKRVELDHNRMVKSFLESRYDETYQSTHVARAGIEINFAQGISGTGWHQREHAQGVAVLAWPGFIRWTGPSRHSEIDLPIATGHAYKLEIVVVDQCAPDALQGAELTLNGRLLKHSMEKGLRASRLVAHVQETALEGRWPARLGILSGAVRELDSREGTDIDHSAGRLCGLAVSRIRLLPA
jgi:hypothetical protein